MATEEIMRYVSAFLTACVGGLIVALVNALLVGRAERGKRQVEFLTRQFQVLYGPLSLLAEQNRQLWALHTKMADGYKKEYEEPNWSGAESTRRALDEETTKTLEKMNEYSRLMKVNNAKMVKILSKNYDLIDPEDEEMFQDFMLAHLRVVPY